MEYVPVLETAHKEDDVRDSKKGNWTEKEEKGEQPNDEKKEEEEELRR